MKNNKDKTMDQVIDELFNLGPKMSQESQQVMERKSDALRMCARILGVDVLFLAHHPDHGMIVGSTYNSEPARKNPEKATELLVENLIKGILIHDQGLLLPILKGLNQGLPNVELSTNVPELFEDDDEDEEENQ